MTQQNEREARANAAARQTGVAIRRMTTADMDQVCALIADAFSDNPSTLANVGGNRAKARRMMRRAVRVAKFGRPWSHGLVAIRGPEIVGALNAVKWPHCQPSAWDNVRMAPSMILIMGLALPRALQMMNRRGAHDPRSPHWHLGPIGVRPDAQGSGVGKRLLTEVLATVDAEGLPAFLETDVDRNVLLYEKFGFTIVNREEILHVDTRFMWRSPAPPPQRV